MTASNNIHSSMVSNILRAKIVFYDSNPIGRISTRFTKDISATDNRIPFLIMLVSRGLIRAISVVISVAVVNPYIVLACALATVYIVYIYRLGIQPTIDSIRLNQIY